MRSSERTERILSILRVETEHLGRFFTVGEKIRDVTAGSSEPASSSLLVVAEACWRALLIGLAGLLSTDQESITLEYLLDHARNHPYDFKQCPAAVLKEMVDEAQRVLRSLSEEEERLRAIRDRRLAHVDRKHVNDPSTLDAFDISPEEASRILAIIEDIITRFYYAYYGEEPLFEVQRQNVRAEFVEDLRVSLELKP